MSYPINKDKRWVDLGLTDNEIRHVVFLCKKFVNGKDMLEDIVQTAIISIYEALEKYRIREVHIQNRNSLIGKVVMNNLVKEYIDKNRKDMLYTTVDIDDTCDNKSLRLIISDGKDFEAYECELNKLIENSLDDNIDKYIAYGYYILELTQEEIGRSIDVHQTWVCARLKNIKNKLKTSYNTLD